MRRTCNTRNRVTGQTCDLLDDHTNGRHFTDDGTEWPDPLAVARRVRRAARVRSEIRAARRGGAR